MSKTTEMVLDEQKYEEKLFEDTQEVEKELKETGKIIEPKGYVLHISISRMAKRYNLNKCPKCNENFKFNDELGTFKCKCNNWEGLIKFSEICYKHSKNKELEIIYSPKDILKLQRISPKLKIYTAGEMSTDGIRGSLAKWRTDLVRDLWDYEEVITWNHPELCGCDHGGIDPQRTVEEDLILIDNSDVVIVNLNREGLYGTIVELMYAISKEKKILVLDTLPSKDFHKEITKSKHGCICMSEFRDGSILNEYWFLHEYIKKLDNVKLTSLNGNKTMNMYLVSELSKDIYNLLHESQKSIYDKSTEQREEFIKTLSSQNKEDFNELCKREPMSKVITYFKRNQKIVKKLKELYNNQCQICGFTFKKDSGENYSETHHLIPLQNNGDDDIKNLVVVCPNCHKKLHYAKKEKYDIKYKEEHYKILGEDK